MYAIDLRFSEFEESLFRQTRETGFAATLATLGLTTSAAFVGGGAAQVLSGIAAFIIGGREAFQKEVLAERTLIAIHTAMRANRARVGVRLREGLRQPINDYPLAIALSDLNDYYDAGTILGALVGITEAVGTQANVQSERLDRVTRGLDPDTNEPITSGTRIGGPASETPKIEGARTPTEEKLLADELRTMQGYLCAKVDGIFGNETRSAIGIWKQGRGFGDTGTLDTDLQARVLLDDALAAGPCDRSTYRNANERLNLANPAALEDFRAKLAALASERRLGVNVPSSVSSIEQLREAIEGAGRELRVDTSNGVTLEFQERLDVAVPEQLPPDASPSTDPN